METHSRVATVARALGIGGAALFAAGPLAIQLGLLSPFLGFRTFMLGILLGLLALLFGLVALWLTRPASGRTGRSRAALGAGLGALLVGVTAVVAGGAGDVPAINDITTDMDDPPSFQAAAAFAANQGRDLSYPGEEFAAQQRKGYPELGPLHVDLPPAQAFQEARRVATELGWEITDERPQQGTLEALQVTRIFRFVDDIVLRIRPAPGGGSRIDVRSKSRDGRGDMGANAARIRAFQQGLAG